jgi:hypothetical protein
MIRSCTKVTCFIVFLSLFALACHSSGSNEQEKPKVELSEVDLSGRWELVSARRDGKITRVLDHTYFIFSEDTLQTNFPSKEGTYSFDRIDNEIVTDEQSPTFYKIISINEDTLEFSLNLRGYLFKLTLVESETNLNREDS